jgi:hypothetical protein
VKIHARLIKVGSGTSFSGTGPCFAVFERFGYEPEFSVRVTSEQARVLGPLLYTWCYVTIESADADTPPHAEEERDE